MISFVEMQEILTEIADSLPPEIYKDLNGGILLSPDDKQHDRSLDDGELYTLGEYSFDPTGLGRMVTIYYGSFCRIYGNVAEGYLRKKLKEVLTHELTHHLEHMAGDKSLERQDEDDIARYRRRHGRKR